MWVEKVKSTKIYMEIIRTIHVYSSRSMKGDSVNRSA